MNGPVFLALAPVAVLALVALTRMLGFNQRGTIKDHDHAALLTQSLPGGFTPADIVIARNGACALLRDQAGRMAVIAASGSHFVVRAVEAGWQVRPAPDGRLAISGGDFSAELDPGDDRARWLALLAGSSVTAD